MSARAAKEVEAREDKLPVAPQTGAAMRGLEPSRDAADQIQSFVVILQSQSPQVVRSEQAYVQGAEPGMFFCQNQENLLVPGEVGFLFQQFGYRRMYTEWVDREKGKGFVDRHDDLPRSAVERSFGKWSLGDNVIVETRYHFGLCHVEGRQFPFQGIMAFASTANNASRMLNGSMLDRRVEPQQARAWNEYLATYNERVDEAKRRGADFLLGEDSNIMTAHLWRLRLRTQKNSKGSWFAPYHKHERPASLEEFVAATELAIRFNAGLIKMGQEAAEPKADVDDEIPF